MSFREAYVIFPRLETERLVLRKMQSSDSEDLFALYSNENVAKYLDWSGVSTVEVASMVIGLFEHQYIKRENLRWGIIDKAADRLIGTIVLGNFHHNLYGDIGYDLAYDAWGKGYMQEALTAVLDYAGQDLGLLRISAYVRPENAASLKLLDKLGFAHEGLLKQAGYHETTKETCDVILLAKILS